MANVWPVGLHLRAETVAIYIYQKEQFTEYIEEMNGGDRPSQTKYINKLLI